MRLTLCVVVVLTVLGTAPAAAEVWSDTDRSGDVKSVRYSPDPAPCGTTSTTKAPGHQTSDLLSLAVAHSADDVTIELGLRKVKERQKIAIHVSMRTSGKAYQVFINRYSPDGQLEANLTPEAKVHQGGICGPVSSGAVVRKCDGLVAEVDPAADVVRVAVPRVCIRSPEWIRVGVGVYGSKGQVSGSKGVTRFEDRWGRRADQPKDNPYVDPLGPRVHTDALRLQP